MYNVFTIPGISNTHEIEVIYIIQSKLTNHSRTTVGTRHSRTFVLKNLVHVYVIF